MDSAKDNYVIGVSPCRIYWHILHKNLMWVYDGNCLPGCLMNKCNLKIIGSSLDGVYFLLPLQCKKSE